MTLYAEQGFEKTTVAEIAARAGLTERTYFRHFADKREALFSGVETAWDLMKSVVEGASAPAVPIDTVGAALQVLGSLLEQDPGLARLRHEIISANPKLRELELAKLAGLAESMTAALRDREVPEPAACLAPEVGIAVFKTAYARWVREPGQPHLPEIFKETMEELRGMLTGRVERDS